MCAIMMSRRYMYLQRTGTFTYRTIVYQAKPYLTSRKVREGLTDVYKLLTSQILLFNFETVATPRLQYVRLILVHLQ